MAKIIPAACTSAVPPITPIMIPASFPVSEIVGIEGRLGGRGSWGEEGSRVLVILWSWDQSDQRLMYPLCLILLRISISCDKLKYLSRSVRWSSVSCDDNIAVGCQVWVSLLYPDWACCCTAPSPGAPHTAGRGGERSWWVSPGSSRSDHRSPQSPQSRHADQSTLTGRCQSCLFWNTPWHCRPRTEETRSLRWWRALREPLSPTSPGSRATSQTLSSPRPTPHNKWSLNFINNWQG